jgi:hypothetical protein
VCVDLALALVDRNLICRRTGYLLLKFLCVCQHMHPNRTSLRASRRLSLATYQVVENALVQRPLELPALPKLLVVVVEALPVLAELCQAVLVDVLQPVLQVRSSSLLRTFPHPIFAWSAQASGYTYTLVAHLVTLRPSLRQSNSPRPFASVLHFM